MARKQCFLACPPSGNMAGKQRFLVCLPLQNMARKQCFLVCQPLGNMFCTALSYWIIIRKLNLRKVIYFVLLQLKPNVVLC